MKKFMKRFRYGEKGFTLIELLIVVAVLGILAAVIVPNLATFLGTGKVAAANTEVAVVETAALAFYADTSDWPTNSALLSTGNYTSAAPEVTYDFDSFGRVTNPNPDDWNAGLTWNSDDHKWTK